MNRAEFDAVIDKAWREHADAPGLIARRVESAAKQAPDAVALEAAVRLLLHVYGVHTGEWLQGIQALTDLKTHPLCGQHPALVQSIARAIGTLELAWDPAMDLDPNMSASDQIQTQAQAANCLMERGNFREASRMLSFAVGRARHQVSSTDPANRALAIAGNNIAAFYQELPLLDADQRASMLEAARIGRVYWEKAGTWLEVERAEYRLSRCAHKAGDASAAIRHAQTCLRICEENQAPAFESFYGIEALLYGFKADYDGDRVMRLKEKARRLFDALTTDEKRWAEPTLQSLLAV